MPRPTAAPLVLALGITLLAAGVALGTGFLVVGAVVVVAGLSIWIVQLLPGRGHVHESLVEPARAPARDGCTGRRGAFAAGHARLPSAIAAGRSSRSPPASRAASSAALVMPVPALLWGLLSGHGLWYPVNLLAGMVLPGVGRMTVPELEQFNASLLVVALVIHVVMSVVIGLIFGVLLPTLPAVPRPIAWGGLLMPLLWTGVSYVAMQVVNPVLPGRVELAVVPALAVRLRHHDAGRGPGGQTSSKATRRSGGRPGRRCGHGPAGRPVGGGQRPRLLVPGQPAGGDASARPGQPGRGGVGAFPCGMVPRGLRPTRRPVHRLRGLVRPGDAPVAAHAGPDCLGRPGPASGMDRDHATGSWGLSTLCSRTGLTGPGSSSRSSCSAWPPRWWCSVRRWSLSHPPVSARTGWLTSWPAKGEVGREETPRGGMAPADPPGRPDRRLRPSRQAQGSGPACAGGPGQGFRRPLRCALRRLPRGRRQARSRPAAERPRLSRHRPRRGVAARHLRGTGRHRRTEEPDAGVRPRQGWPADRRPGPGAGRRDQEAMGTGCVRGSDTAVPQPGRHQEREPGRGGPRVRPRLRRLPRPAGTGRRARRPAGRGHQRSGVPGADQRQGAAAHRDHRPARSRDAGLRRHGRSAGRFPPADRRRRSTTWWRCWRPGGRAGRPATNDDFGLTRGKNDGTGFQLAALGARTQPRSGAALVPGLADLRARRRRRGRGGPPLHRLPFRGPQGPGQMAVRWGASPIFRRARRAW